MCVFYGHGYCILRFTGSCDGSPESSIIITSASDVCLIILNDVNERAVYDLYWNERGTDKLQLQVMMSKLFESYLPMLVWERKDAAILAEKPDIPKRLIELLDDHCKIK